VGRFENTTLQLSKKVAIIIIFQIFILIGVCPMFCNFYAVKNHKIANFSTNDEAREKLRIDFESFKFCKFSDEMKV
jgi:hypothetical protein